MKHGDFTELAQYYGSRAGYSPVALRVIRDYLSEWRHGPDLVAADVGAGTGKLTEALYRLDLSGFAVEPNDAMRAQGEKSTKDLPFVWSTGTGEHTGLPDHCADWVVMGSSFHWTDASAALKEFSRILRPNGFFTAVWNPRDLSKSEIGTVIEKKIYELVPGLQRVSSGGRQYMSSGYFEKLLAESGAFTDLFFVQASHEERMSPERYVSVWRSVNDIQVQAGEKKFQEILNMIQREIADMPEIVVPYDTRAWTMRLK